MHFKQSRGMQTTHNSSLWPKMMRTGLCAFMLTAIQPQLSDLYAQNVTVTLSMRNATVEQVLDQIEKKTDYTFVASDRTVDLNRKVSLNVQSLSLEETLQKLFAGTNVSYSKPMYFIASISHTSHLLDASLICLPHLYLQSYDKTLPQHHLRLLQMYHCHTANCRYFS